MGLAVRVPVAESLGRPPRGRRAAASCRSQRDQQGDQGRRASCRTDEADQRAYVRTQFRHAPAPEGHGHPHDPGPARPQGRVDDDDLHARPSVGRLRGCEPAGRPSVRRRRVTPVAGVHHRGHREHRGGKETVRCVQRTVSRRYLNRKGSSRDPVVTGYVTHGEGRKGLRMARSRASWRRQCVGLPTLRETVGLPPVCEPNAAASSSHCLGLALRAVQGGNGNSEILAPAPPLRGLTPREQIPQLRERYGARQAAGSAKVGWVAGSPARARNSAGSRRRPAETALLAVACDSPRVRAAHTRDRTCWRLPWRTPRVPRTVPLPPGSGTGLICERQSGLSEPRKG